MVAAVVARALQDQRWLAELAPSTARYPGRIEAPRGDNFGVALYARGALDGGVEALGSELPTIVARTAGVAIVVAHPMPPVSRAGAAQQARMLDALAARVRGGAPLVLAGDLNAAPWSRPFARFLAATGLRDTRAGFGVQATFPASSWLLRIPLDHVLVSPGIGVTRRRVERDVGSDHLPVYIELALPSAHAEDPPGDRDRGGGGGVRAEERR